MKRYGIILASVLALLLLIAIPIASSADGSPDSLSRYGATTVEGNEKYVYESLVAGINKEVPDAKITLDKERGVTLDQLKRAYTVFINDYPECFWVTNGYSYSYLAETVVAVEPVYSFTGAELNAAREELDAAVEAIVDGMTASTNYERALYLHDALAEAVVYEHVGHHQTAYGALVAGRAVCAGYAAAYQLLLNRVGITACTVSGDSADPTTGTAVAHAWNAVWLDADTCVYTDVTWDDQGDTVYHYYFNISAEEMEEDHVTNTEVFTQPECNHTSSSYFDANSNTVTDESTPEQVAALFGENRGGERSAVLYYDGTEGISAWLSDNLHELYVALGGGAGTYGYSVSSLGKEYHLTVSGNFPVTSRYVDIVSGEGMEEIASGAVSAPVDEPIGDVIIRANSGYYFPEDYSVASSSGISVTRLSYTELKLSGTPTEDVVITLPDATAKTQREKPSAVFNASGSASGMLYAVNTDWVYSLDGGKNWLDIELQESLLDGVSSEWGILVKHPEDDTHLESETQTIVITVLASPVGLETVKCSAEGAADGVISGLSNNMEYRSESSEEWLPVTSDKVEGLTAGTYFVRYKASGTALASEAVSVRIKTVCPHASVIEVPAKTATCKEDGHAAYSYCAECEDIISGSNEVIKGEHSFGEWTVTKEPEGLSAGLQERVCSVCEHKEEQLVPPAPIEETVKAFVSEHKAVIIIVIAVLLVSLVAFALKKKR